MDCLFCSRKFPRKGGLEEHYRKHTLERPHFCSKCPRELVTKRSLLDHLDTHKLLNERGKKCPLCGKRILSRQQYPIHIKSHNGERKFECKICDKKFTTRSILKRHESVLKNLERFPCNICDKYLSSKQILKFHIKTVHAKKRYECHLCGRKFATKSNFRLHLKTHDPNRKHFNCDKCPKTFLLKRSYDEHQLIHQDQEYSLQCDKCERRFLTSKKLKKHKSYYHLEKREIFPCVFCEKRCQNFHKLQYHLAGHTQERPYLCRQCPAELRELGTLAQHNKVNHSKIREKFNCDICPKSFLKKNSLNAHIRKHTGELFYQCKSPGCEMKFYCSNTRSTHYVMAHSGKQFSCTLCAKNFPRNSDLKRHAISHLNFQAYKCDICDLSFKHIGSLKAHKGRVHALE